MGRVMVVADVSNLYYCIGKKFEGRRLDYSAWIKFIKDIGEAVKMVAYGAQLTNEAKSFIHCLRRLGFQTRYKKPKIFKNREGKKRKADWDVGITLDIVNAIEQKAVDMVILGSADSDLEPLVIWAKARGVDVVVFACGISRELKKSATKFIEIPESLLESITPIGKEKKVETPETDE